MWVVSVRAIVLIQSVTKKSSLAAIFMVKSWLKNYTIFWLAPELNSLKKYRARSSKWASFATLNSLKDYSLARLALERKWNTFWLRVISLLSLNLIYNKLLDSAWWLISLITQGIYLISEVFTEVSTLQRWRRLLSASCSLKPGVSSVLCILPMVLLAVYLIILPCPALLYRAKKLTWERTCKALEPYALNWACFLFRLTSTWSSLTLSYQSCLMELLLVILNLM